MEYTGNIRAGVRGLSTVAAQHDLETGAGTTKFLLPVTLCFFLSGCAALLYQTAWLRQFSLVFGTSELAVATVLAAYMGGLAAGAAAAGRYLARVRRPVLVYGALEAGIALCALSVPLLLAAASGFYAWVLGGRPAPPDAATLGQPMFYLGVAFLVLALPTGFMGATLPLLTRYVVRTDREIGPKVALLYAVNTAGAVIGAVAAGFLLLPALGLHATVWTGVALNALIFVIAAWLSRALPAAAEKDGSARPAVQPPVGFVAACIAPLLDKRRTLAVRLRAAFRAQPAWIMPLMLISGANAFLYEVLWTRMLAHVIGSSIYAFATMLAAFLSGIALGGGLAARASVRRDVAAYAFAFTQVGIAVLSMGVYGWMGTLLPAEQTTAALTSYAILVMLPATVFIGATFPLAVRLLTRDEHEAGTATARIYAWNTLGAIAGAVLTGFFVIPLLGFEGAIKIGVSINLVLAAWTAAFVAAPKPSHVGATAAALLLVLLFYAPARPQAVVTRTGYIPDALEAPTELYYAVGRSSTVMLLEEGGYYYLRTNGLPEASIAARGGIASGDATRWLGVIPVLVRPEAESMLMIGFGGGVALEGIPSSVREIDVVELEPEVIDANRTLSGLRSYDPLEDPRVRIVINDARNALRLTDKTYDAVVSQPSHPWTAGASHLFTREFLAESKRHLETGGVFVQWMNAEFLDEALLRSLAATLLAEFSQVRLYQPAARFLVFVASDATMEPELELARSGRPLTADVMHYSRVGVHSVEDAVAALMMDEAGLKAFAEGAPASTDDRNYMATRSRPHADGLSVAQLAELAAPFDPLLEPGSWIHTRLRNQLDFGYLAARLAVLEQPSRIVRLAELAPDASTQWLIRALLLELDGRPEEALQGLVAAVRANPRNLQARYRLVERLWTPGDLNALEALGPTSAGLDGAVAAVLAGWAHQANRDWLSLARLDGELGRSRVTDAWYPQAARLRAEWRLNVTQERQRYAADALRLIDRALLLEPDRDLYLLRATAAVVLEDGDLIVESCRYVAETIRSRLSLAEESGRSVEPRELTAMRQNLSVVIEQLEGSLVARDTARTREVLRAAQSGVEAIDAYRPPEAL